MQGHNAEYLEQLYAQYAHDPDALDETWQEFFKAMGDDEVSIKKDAAGPSWGRRDWPPKVNDDLIAALDCLLYTSPSPRDAHESRMPSSA